MTLYVAGVIHYDPLGRKRLGKWLKHLKKKDIKPSYVLVEYNEKDHLAFPNARKKFRNLCEKKLAKYGLSDDDFNILEGSLGYELGSHLDSFDNIDILYYEELKFCEVTIKGIYDNYSKMIFLENYDKNSGNFIDILSKELWKDINEKSEFPKYGTKRDQYLFEQIKDKTRSFLNNDGLLIVGVNHTKDCPNKLVNLLKESKIYKNIDITDLEDIL